MHVHVYWDVMRTTIEIKEEHRARLLELAARRREKGFSRIVAEAIEAYLRTVARDEESVRRALELRGSLSRAEGDRLRAEVKRIRESWR